MVWSAFAVLSDSRPVGTGPSAIPLTEIEAYLRLYGISSTEIVDEWVYLIRQMDAEYLQYVADQRDKQ